MNKYPHIINNQFANYFKQHNSKDQFNLLDAGCNSGRNIQPIVQMYPKANIYGIDLLPDAIVKARQLIPNGKFYVGDLQDCSLFYNWEYFDYILLLDVLEHLTQPEKVLQYLKTTLKSDGCIIANIPNLMHWSVIKNLILSGTFTYTSLGLLDYDHKHLFTYKEIRRLFESTGFKITEILILKAGEIPVENREFFNNLVKFSNGAVDISEYEAMTYTLIAQKV